MGTTDDGYCLLCLQGLWNFCSMVLVELFLIATGRFLVESHCIQSSQEPTRGLYHPLIYVLVGILADDFGTDMRARERARERERRGKILVATVRRCLKTAAARCKYKRCAYAKCMFLALSRGGLWHTKTAPWLHACLLCLVLGQKLSAPLPRSYRSDHQSPEPWQTKDIPSWCRTSS